MRVFRDGIEQGQPVQLPFTIAQTNAFNYILHEQGVLLQDAYEMCRVWSRMGRRGQPTYRYKPILIQIPETIPIQIPETIPIQIPETIPKPL